MSEIALRRQDVEAMGLTLGPACDVQHRPRMKTHRHAEFREGEKMIGTELEKQHQYLKRIYEGGAPCPVCGMIQTPWQASGTDFEQWVGSSEREYVCVECKAPLRHDVYLTGGWGWGNPNVVAHR